MLWTFEFESEVQGAWKCVGERRGECKWFSRSSHSEKCNEGEMSFLEGAVLREICFKKIECCGHSNLNHRSLVTAVRNFTQFQKGVRWRFVISARRMSVCHIACLKDRLPERWKSFRQKPGWRTCSAWRMKSFRQDESFRQASAGRIFGPIFFPKGHSSKKFSDHRRHFWLRNREIQKAPEMVVFFLECAFFCTW